MTRERDLFRAIVVSGAALCAGAGVVGCGGMTGGGTDAGTDAAMVVADTGTDTGMVVADAGTDAATPVDSGGAMDMGMSNDAAPVEEDAFVLIL